MILWPKLTFPPINLWTVWNEQIEDRAAKEWYDFEEIEYNDKCESRDNNEKNIL